jgi:hypothetical protein
MRWSHQVLLIAAFSAACTAGAGKNNDGSSAGSGGRNGGDGDIGPGDGDITAPGDGDGDGGNLPVFDGTIESNSSDTITVSGDQFSVAFTLMDRDGNPVNAEWSTDDTRIGSISSDGIFTGSGFVGGVVQITAFPPGAILTTTLTVNVDITENTAGLSESDQTSLLAGGNADATFKWLYPYSGTVFPRGISAPLLQLAGSTATSTYLEITAEHFVYRRFGGASLPIAVQLNEQVWHGLSLTVRPGAAAHVAMTKAGPTGVSAKEATTWYFAAASLKGIFYYSTYNYRNDGPIDEKAAIMAVRAGGQAQVVQTGCTACHTVSANGNVLAAGRGNGPDSTQNNLWNPVASDSYNILENATINPRTQTNDGRTFSFLALSPDGSVGVTNGLPSNLLPPYRMWGVHVSNPVPSQLVNTANASVIATNLNSLVTFAQTPAFSPDGTRLAFVNGDYLAENSSHRVLSVLDADLTANPPAFSNLRNVVQNTSNVTLAWPTFLPDGNGIVYQEGDSFDSHEWIAQGAPYGPSHSELRLANIEAGTQSNLDALNGRNPDGSTYYFPYGGDEEGRMNYEASVLPVAVGGYYWVIFTSRRAYGNEIAPGGRIPEVDNEPWGTESLQSPRKKIWLAAINVDYASSTDPSHPAFYLPGQGLESGNMRGFAALAPCRAEGETCESGSDCCGGFCRETERTSAGTPILRCVPPPDTCSNVDELCETAADCCNSSNQCINNRCAEPTPPVVR